MASYSLRIKVSAARELERIPDRRVRRQIVRRIEALALEPRPRGCEKLAGGEDRYRIRQGAYRIVYSVEDEALVVWIIKIGHRKDAYR